MVLQSTLDSKITLSKQFGWIFESKCTIFPLNAVWLIMNSCETICSRLKNVETLTKKLRRINYTWLHLNQFCYLLKVEKHLEKMLCRSNYARNQFGCRVKVSWYRNVFLDQNSNENIVRISALKVFIASLELPEIFLGLPVGFLIYHIIY